MKTDIIANRFNQIANKYDEQRRYFIPCFDDYYKTCTSFLSAIKNDFKSILDLGAGTGLLSKYLFDNFPNAQFTLVDVSDQMLEIARKRFSGLKNFKFIISDYSKELPGNKFDLITSALSIHHLHDDNKLELYSAIYNKLEDNGYFLNLDQFNASSGIVNKSYTEWWYDYIKQSISPEMKDGSWQQRRELDKENTVPETINFLNEAGFKTVECIYSFMKFSVILAIK
jgi:tRNA (cmo5U34)-methyltransferase